MTEHRHRIPLLSKKFRFADQHVFCGYARFFGDRIDLDGWRLTGRVQRRIPLARVVDIQYHPLDETGNLMVMLDDGEEVQLVVEDAHRWRLAFEGWLSYHVLASAKVLPERHLADAIAG